MRLAGAGSRFCGAIFCLEIPGYVLWPQRESLAAVTESMRPVGF
jgi:hypothetical protein